MARISDLFARKNLKTQGILVGAGVVALMLLAGCSGSGEGGATLSPPPREGGASAEAGGSSPGFGMFAGIAAIGTVLAIVAWRRGSER